MFEIPSALPGASSDFNGIITAELFPIFQELEKEKERGPLWHLRGLEVSWDSLEELYGEFGLPPQLPSTTWRTSVPVYHGREQVGYATSGCWSPLLKKYIALAHLHAAHAKLGTEVRMEVTVEHRRKKALARVVDLPFYNPERKRAKT